MRRFTAMHFGAFSEARSEFEAILRLYDPSRHRSEPVHYVHDPKVSALTYLALVLWTLGLPEQARRSSVAAFQCAAELDQANLYGACIGATPQRVKRHGMICLLGMTRLEFCTVACGDQIGTRSRAGIY